MKKMPFLVFAILVAGTAMAQTKVKKIATTAKQPIVAATATTSGSNDSIPIPMPPQPAKPVKNGAAIIKAKPAKSVPESAKLTPSKIIKDTL